MTMIRPRNSGIDPTTSPPATIKPQIAIGPGFVITARIDVATAVLSPTSRSSNSGKETTLIVSTSTANRNPIPTPRMINAQPTSVVNTARANEAIDAGGSGPSVRV